MDVTHDHVSDPQGRLIEHGVGVVLILGADVEKLVATPAEEQASLVEVGREQSAEEGGVELQQALTRIVSGITLISKLRYSIIF